jgi:hypothetical protein
MKPFALRSTHVAASYDTHLTQLQSKFTLKFPAFFIWHSVWFKTWQWHWQWKCLVIEVLCVQFILWWELWNWNFVHTGTTWSGGFI